MPIMTNKVIPVFDYLVLDKEFDFFTITTSEKYIRGGATILDLPSENIKIHSLLFDRGKRCYVMIRKNPDSFQWLKQAALRTENAESLFFSRVTSREIAQRDLLQLLLNGTGNTKTSTLAFNNLTGHLYCFHPAWQKTRKNGQKSEVIKVPCLEISVNESYMLQLNVRTFTSIKLKSKIKFGKHKLEDYPKYTFGKRRTLKRSMESADDECFILRQEANDKTEIPFLDIQNIDKFTESKMGVLTFVLERFNELYEGAASISFELIDEYGRIDHRRKEDKENKAAIIDKLQTTRLRIVDRIGDECSMDFCNKMADLIEQKYGIRPSIGQRLSQAGLNIVLIHNEAYYNGESDPHADSHQGYAVQHITLEDFFHCAEHAVSTVVNELMIKEDLRNGQISLFNWSKLGYKNTLLFGCKVNGEQSDCFVFMRIAPDGSFSIEEFKLDLLSAGEYAKYASLFSTTESRSEMVSGIVSDEQGNINIIKDTGWYTIPDILGIKNELVLGNNRLRGKEPRQQFLDAVLDIKWFKIGEQTFYFSNDIGEGMRTIIPRAANIREIKSYAGSGSLFDSLFQTLDVSFVRNGQLTVIPFPFKYLREYIKLNYIASGD